MARFILKKDTSNHYYWILKSDKNYKIVAMSSEAYESKQGALDSIDWTRTNAENASFDE